MKHAAFFAGPFCPWRKEIFATAAILLALLPCAVAAEPVRVAILAFRPIAEMQARWQPLADYLNRAIPERQFALRVYKYPELEAAIAARQVDFVLTQPAHYVTMTYRNGLSSPLATLVEHEAGHALSMFGGVVFALAGRGDIATLADLKGKRIATSSVSSLGSYQMQVHELADAGVRLPHDASVIETGQPQDMAVAAVLDRRADAGFVRTGVIEAMAKEGKLDLSALKIINPLSDGKFPYRLSTRLYPEWAFAAMPDIDGVLARRVAASLLLLEHGGEVARAVGIEGFTVPADYHSVDDLLRELRLPPFDAMPEFSAQDVWGRYQASLAIAGVVLSLILLAVVAWLWLANRRLKVNRSELRQSRDELRKLSQAVEQSPVSIVIADLNGRIDYVNEFCVGNSGYSREELIGKNPRIFSSGQTPPTVYAEMWSALLAGRTWQGELTNLRKDGGEFVEYAIIAPIRSPDGQTRHYLAVKQDITQRKAVEEEVRYLAFYDSLTHLPNRRLLLDRLQHALLTTGRSRRQGALMLIDLDNFKTLNDTHGHMVGDQLLQQIAPWIAGCLREGDTVGRLGGDEFVVMLENLSEKPSEAAAQVRIVGEKVVAALNQAFRFGESEHYSSASIGVTLFCGFGERGDEDASEAVDGLLRQADLAMYQAKAAGRNTLRFFDHAMQAVVSARATIETDLRQGVKEGQFVLHYQAQVDAAGRLTGVEALLRWRHPKRGMVSPAEFIPVAEETGLILPLGHWVLKTACRQLVVWAQQADMAHLSVAVNVSALQFRRVDFVSQVLAVIEETGAVPGRLKLELTESMLLDNIEEIIEKMRALKAKGVGFSLDDFGTGYSSLSYLKRLPLDQLKIDQSFVRDVLSDPNDAAIAKTIVALGQSMGLAVIAEGVETVAQRNLLAQIGCYAYQGYLFGRPGPVESLNATNAYP